MNRRHTFFILFIWTLLGCNPDRHQRSQPTGGDIKESMINANRIMMENENRVIEAYVANSEVEYERTGTGLRYHIIRAGVGSPPESEDTVRVSYTVHLLNNELVEEKKVTDNFRWVIGKSDVLRGLEYGVSQLGAGGSITLVVPSHLAYGRFGDSGRVPGSSPVIVKATLHSIAKAKS